MAPRDIQISFRSNSTNLGAKFGVALLIHITLLYYLVYTAILRICKTECHISELRVFETKLVPTFGNNGQLINSGNYSTISGYWYYEWFLSLYLPNSLIPDAPRIRHWALNFSSRVEFLSAIIALHFFFNSASCLVVAAIFTTSKSLKVTKIDLNFSVENITQLDNFLWVKLMNWKSKFLIRLWLGLDSVRKVKEMETYDNVKLAKLVSKSRSKSW